MDDGGLASRPLYFNGLVGGKSCILEGTGVETGHILIAGVVELVGCGKEVKTKRKKG